MRLKKEFRLKIFFYISSNKITFFFSDFHFFPLLFEIKFTTTKLKTLFKKNFFLKLVFYFPKKNSCKNFINLFKMFSTVLNKIEA